jgi:hypothetical protein
MADWTRGLLDGLRWEMHDYYCERSKRWQESDKGDTFMEQLQHLAKTISRLEELSQDWSLQCPTHKTKPPPPVDPFD